MKRQDWFSLLLAVLILVLGVSISTRDRTPLYYDLEDVKKLFDAVGRVIQLQSGLIPGKWVPGTERVDSDWWSHDDFELEKSTNF